MCVVLCCVTLVCGLCCFVCGVVLCDLGVWSVLCRCVLCCGMAYSHTPT